MTYFEYMAMKHGASRCFAPTDVIHITLEQHVSFLREPGIEVEFSVMEPDIWEKNFSR